MTEQQATNQAIVLLLKQQIEDGKTILQQEERLFALECALEALDHRAVGILKIRASEAHEANHEKYALLQTKLDTLLGLFSESGKSPKGKQHLN